MPEATGVGNVSDIARLLFAVMVRVRVVPAGAGSGDTDTELIVMTSPNWINGPMVLTEMGAILVRPMMSHYYATMSVNVEAAKDAVTPCGMDCLVILRIMPEPEDVNTHGVDGPGTVSIWIESVAGDAT